MTDVAEILQDAGIKLASIAPGKHSATCPKCSAQRQPHHRRIKCLGVKIDEQGVCWRCNHCGWSGPERGSGGNSHARGFAATYDYCDADGILRFQKVRYPEGHEPRFRMRRPNGAGGWAWGAKGVDTKLLYRIDEVQEAIALHRDIAIVEGEKDADALWAIGIPATCSAFGASNTDKPKWYREHSEQLRSASIIVFNDNDAAGYAHADATCRLSLGIAKRVRALDLKPHWSHIPVGGDISDWLDAGHTREQLDALMLRAPDYGDGPHQARDQTHTKAPTPLTLASAEALQSMTFPRIKYVVPGIIVEGLTLLAGKPKIGKSWLLLHTAIAVARGGFTLGDIHCIEGDVLYCALEDNLRRVQSRMTKLLGIAQPWPKRLHFYCEMPRLTEGGLDVIKNWIKAAEHPRLIIIDTLAMVRAPKKKDQTQYDADYNAVVELRTLANKHGIAVVVVHHLRKMDADDAFDTVSGTLGLTGAPDTVLVMKYDRSGSRTVVLQGRGRDLVEIEKAVSFNKDTCVWTITGDVPDVRSSAERKAVLTAMQEIGGEASVSAIAASAELKRANVRRMLARLAEKGNVQRCGRGKYKLAVDEHDGCSPVKKQPTTRGESAGDEDVVESDGN